MQRQCCLICKVRGGVRLHSHLYQNRAKVLPNTADLLELRLRKVSDEYSARLLPRFRLPVQVEVSEISLMYPGGEC